MGLAVLNPEDCLKLAYPMKHPKNSCRNPNPNPNRTNRKNRYPNNSSRQIVGYKVPARNLVMGQVKILKRGEDLKKTAPEKPVRFEKENVNVDLGSTNRLGPDPGSVPTKIRLTESNNSNKVVPVPFYAGSAFITSPPPSSVPMPAFFTKKIGVADATSDLRRILRLDL